MCQVVLVLLHLTQPLQKQLFCGIYPPLSKNYKNAIRISTIRTHTQQKCIYNHTVLSFITCWEWPTRGHPCLKTIKWISSCSHENVYRHRYPKREKIYWDRDLIDWNQTEWYMHKVKSQSFSLLIFTHTQSEIPSHLKEETIEGRNLR